MVDDRDELEVSITPDGLGRAGIVRRDDGLLCIYVVWKWPNDGELYHPDEYQDWFSDHTPLSVLCDPGKYDEDGRYPESGIYGTLGDARRELKALRGFADAVLKPPAQSLHISKHRA